MTEPEMFVVVMFESVLEGENLRLSEQVNEVFGPFDTDTEAEEWAERAEQLIPSREWLIIPVSNKSSLNAVDPDIN
jgi:hypothetical protein